MKRHHRLSLSLRLRVQWTSEKKRTRPCVLCMCLCASYANNNLHQSPFSSTLLLPGVVAEKMRGERQMFADGWWSRRLDRGRGVEGWEVISINHEANDATTNLYTNDESKIWFVHCFSKALANERQRNVQAQSMSCTMTWFVVRVKSAQ